MRKNGKKSDKNGGKCVIKTDIDKGLPDPRGGFSCSSAYHYSHSFFISSIMIRFERCTKPLMRSAGSGPCAISARS